LDETERSLADDEAGSLILPGFPSVRTVSGEKHRDRGLHMFAYLGLRHPRWRLSDQGIQMMLRDHRAEKELRGAQQRLGTDLSRPAVSGWARQRSTVSKGTRRALAHDSASAR